MAVLLFTSSPFARSTPAKFVVIVMPEISSGMFPLICPALFRLAEPRTRARQLTDPRPLTAA